MRRRLKSDPASVTTTTISTFAAITCSSLLLPGAFLEKQVFRGKRARIICSSFSPAPNSMATQSPTAGSSASQEASCQTLPPTTQSTSSASSSRAEKLIFVSRINRPGTQLSFEASLKAFSKSLFHPRSLSVIAY